MYELHSARTSTVCTRSASWQFFGFSGNGAVAVAVRKHEMLCLPLYSLFTATLPAL